MARGRGFKRCHNQRKKFKAQLPNRRKRDLIDLGELHPADVSDCKVLRIKRGFENSRSENTTLKNSPCETSMKKKGNTSNNNNLLNSASDTDSSTDVDPLVVLRTTFKRNCSKKTLNNLYDNIDNIEDSNLKKKQTFKKHVHLPAPFATSEEDTGDDLDEMSNESSIKLDDNTFDIDQDYEEELDIEGDPFVAHFENEIPQSVVSEIHKKYIQEAELKWPACGMMKFMRYTNEDIPGNFSLSIKNNTDKFHIKKDVLKNVEKTIKLYRANNHGELSKLQLEILSVITNYHDLFYPEKNFENGEDIRLVYCLHALNHILKTRSRILHHNNKLSKHHSMQVEYRDQGLTRPKILIIVPFRESALRIVTLLISLLCCDEKSNVINKKRFQDEYSAEEPDPSKKLQRPEDYEALFAGNIDDAFRIGLSITKKSLKLYADFYSADIIVASPLGLRTIIGAEGEKDRDYDFLSSIEIAIFDQTDVFLMQNWEHVLHLMHHLHLQPQTSHGCDFFRVRMWILNGWAKYYRQTLIFSSMMVPAISALYSKYCFNYAGKVIVRNPVLSPSIGQVVIQLPQVFYSFDTSNMKTSADDRFNFFINKILPNIEDSNTSHTLIFIPSYLDFVRVRNYFKKEEISCAQVCEYTKHAKVAKARDLFFHGHRHYLLYTERFHFFRRYRIKGIRHIIFYQLPLFSNFYSEMCNFLHRSMQRKSNIATESTVSCTILYCHCDAHLLAGVVGDHRASLMLNSEKKVHLLVTGE